MSELINSCCYRTTIRWKLLTGVSALALTGYVTSAISSLADDGDHPQVWIELGGQAERVEDSFQKFLPPFLANTPRANLAPMIEAQRPPPYTLGLDGKISFTPQNSDWVFSAAVRYGKSTASRHKHQQTPLPYVHQYLGTNVQSQPGISQFGDGQSDYRQSHMVLDFQAGKDVGVGLFGKQGSSIVSAGVRFAQFTSSSTLALNARPQNEIGPSHHASFRHYVSLPTPHYATFAYKKYDFIHHTYAATMSTRRSTHALGPSLSWNASLAVAGNDTDMSVDFDWGLNAAVLFGRQRTHVKHKTSGQYYSKTGAAFKYHDTKFGGYTRGVIVRTGSYQHGPSYRDSSRRVTIPNIGGFAGVSLKFPNAKISLGYRADFFLGASDSGIDQYRRENVSYYGPFASVSVGLGG